MCVVMTGSLHDASASGWLVWNNTVYLVEWVELFRVRCMNHVD